MIRLARALATVGGVGRARYAPGTFGSLVGLAIAVWWPVGLARPMEFCLFAALLLIGTWAADVTERTDHVHDPGYVVVDEVIGMWLTLLFVPSPHRTVWVGLIAFVLFRVFDIWKPPPLKWLSRFPGGWGIVLDDVGAGLYAGLLTFLAQYVWLRG